MQGSLEAQQTLGSVGSQGHAISRPHSDLFLAADPILSQALQLIQRVRAGEPLHAEAERRQLLASFYAGDAMFGASKSWKLASYALASWIDEMLVDLPWEGASWWQNNILEVELFHSRECGKRFFAYANEALQLADRTCLSLFRDCVVLGFRGMYSTPEQSKILADELGLPADLASWLVFTNQACEELHETAPYFPQQTEIGGAAPQALRGPIMWWAVVTAFLTAINVVIYFS